MRNKKIGHIILKGGTIKDLQKEFPDFPDEVTTSYFIKIGYAENTARTYCSLLNRNTIMESVTKLPASEVKSAEEKPVSEENTSEKISSSKSVSSLEIHRDDIKNNIISSENANFDNILVDTCALGYSETLNIIETANQVTFIHSTLKEMDNKKNLDKKRFATLHEKTLAYNIRLYTDKILENPDKFLLSNFSGYGADYVDDILLQYLLILPKKIRPTLLTADKNLAVRAKANDLEFILKINSVYSKTSSSQTSCPLDFVSSSLSHSTSSTSSSLHSYSVTNMSPKPCTLQFVKKYGYGVNLFTDGTSNYIFAKIPQKLTIIRFSGECISYKPCSFANVNNGDIVCVHIKSKDNVIEHKYKIGN